MSESGNISGLENIRGNIKISGINPAEIHFFKINMEPPKQ